MARVNLFEEVEITTGPQAITIDNYEASGTKYNQVSYVVIKSTGSVALAGATTITAAAAGLVEGLQHTFIYRAQLTTTDIATKYIQIFGYKLTEAQMTQNLTIECRYEGGAWVVQVNVDFEESNIIGESQIQTDAVTTSKIKDDAVTTAKILDANVTTAKIANNAVQTAKIDALAVTDAKIASGVDGAKLTANTVTLDKIVASTRGYIPVSAGASGDLTMLNNEGAGNLPFGQGAGNDIASHPITGDITVSASGVATIGALKVLNGMINTGAVTNTKLGSASVSADKLATNVNRWGHTIPVSFETGEQCNNRWVAPYDGQVDEIHWYVVKAIAGTDNGSIDPQDAGGSTMGGSAITIPLSSALNTGGSVVSIASNNTFSKGDVLKFITAKTTAGGKVLLTIHTSKT